MGKQQEPEYEVEYIENHKIKTGKNKKNELWFEIKWKGYSAKENTWEPSESTANAKELVDKYWATKGGGNEERIRCENLVKGEKKSVQKEKKTDKEEEKKEELPRQTRSNKNKSSPAASKKNETPSKKRKVVEDSGSEEDKKKVEYQSDSENDDYSESEIENERFRTKSNWKTDVAKVIEVRAVANKSGKNELRGLVRWHDGKLGLYKTSFIGEKNPQKLIKYYEKKLTFETK